MRWRSSGAFAVGTAFLLAGCVGGGPAAAPTPTELATEAPDVAQLLAEDPAVVPADGERYTNPGATIHHDGRWWMLRNSFTTYSEESRTDLLVSDDLTSWAEVDEANPLFTTADLPGTDGSVFAMSAVVDDDGTWVAYLYDFNGASQSGSIHRATAPGPEGPWAVAPSPVLTPGDEGAWDALRVGEPQVVRHGGEWLMWFTGYEDTVPPDRGAIGLATSPDGVTWTKHDGPVLVGDQGWTGGSVADARVVHDGTGFVMVYRTRARGAFGNGLAFSEDGRAWTSWAGNPILEVDDVPDGNGLWQSALVASGDGIRYLLESGSLAGTAVHPWAIDVASARAAPLPRIATSVTVDGDSVTIEVDVPGIDLAFGEDEADGPVAHPHAFVDTAPTAAGHEVPVDVDAIVHSPDSPLVVEGLDLGDHVITILLADDDDVALDLPVPVIVEVTTS